MTNEAPPATTGPFRSRRLRRRGGHAPWVLWVPLLVLATFAIGYGLTAVLFFPSSDRPPVVAVPDLRDMDAGAARTAARELGLEIELGDSFPNPEVPAGRVLSQTPLPGQEVAPGTPVVLIVSAGAERRTVPVVASMTREQAEGALEAMGFAVQVEEVEDPRAAGRVVGVEPAAGTVLTIPATVRLRVSSGPPLVAVPDLAGLSEQEAAAILAEAGLELGEVSHRFAGFYAEESIEWQDPEAGATVPEGTPVDLRIASDRLPGRPIR